MSNNTIIVMTALVILGIITLMVLNFAPKMIPDVTPGKPPAKEEQQAPTIPKEVRGMALIHNGLPFTLNFQQQNLANDAIYNAAEVKKSDFKQETLNFEKITVFNFNAPEFDVFPVTYSENNLVFSAPAMNSNSYFMELSGGAMQKMINGSFDP